MVPTSIKVLVAVYAVICVIGCVESVAPHGRGPLRRGYIVEQLPTDDLPSTLADPLFLTPYLEKGQTDLARQLSKVTPNVGSGMSHAGFLTTNKKYNSNMFFWFFPALNGDPKAPVILWLQGGPGSSSLFGLFVEIGPVYITQDQKVVPNPHTWNDKYSLLFIDNPVGTGYSFTGSDDGYSRSQDDVADNLYEALSQFFQIFSAHQPNDFYVTGESYAGKYVPSITYRIHRQNQQSPKVFINLKGLAIGDGWSDPRNMVPMYPPIIFQMGFSNWQQTEYITGQCNAMTDAIDRKDYMTAYKLWDNMLNGDTTGYPSYFYNITGVTDYYNIMNTNPPPEFDYWGSFVQSAATRGAIHVGNLPFTQSTKVEMFLANDVMQTVAPLFPTLLANYRVMIYSGQLDVIVGASLTESFLNALQWSGAQGFARANKTIWKVQPKDVDVAGWARAYQNLTHVIVRSAGHILPWDQPVRGYDMLTRFIKGQPFTN